MGFQPWLSPASYFTIVEASCKVHLSPSHLLGPRALFHCFSFLWLHFTMLKTRNRANLMLQINLGNGRRFFWVVILSCSCSRCSDITFFMLENNRTSCGTDVTVWRRPFDVSPQITYLNLAPKRDVIVTQLMTLIAWHCGVVICWVDLGNQSWLCTTFDWKILKCKKI